MTDYEHSYYSATRNVTLTGTESLSGRERTDVCIIGGGITGCSAALHLSERGYRVRLLEAARIGWGASGRSGGQIIPGLDVNVAGLRRQIGAESVRAIWDMTREAVDLVREQVARNRIDCDLKWGYVHAAARPRQMRELEAWHSDLVNNLGYDGLQLLDRHAANERIGAACYHGGAYQPDAGHLHPLNYTLGLARAAQTAGATLHEQSRVTSITRGARVRVATTAGEVEADHLLLCGNAYLSGVAPDVERTVLPVNTYILATEPLDPARVPGVLPHDDAVADLNLMLDYYRLSADRRLLFGGRVSYTGKRPRNLEGALRRRMTRVFPQLNRARTGFVWGGMVGVTRNGTPHFGRAASNIFYAQGYTGHGMALTGLAGKLLAELVAGQTERFDVFTRIAHRPFPGGRSFSIPLRVLGTIHHRLRELL